MVYISIMEHRCQNPVWKEDEDGMKSLKKCGAILSHYMDKQELHEIWLCWSCGKFKGGTAIPDLFLDTIIRNPLMLIDLLAEGKMEKKN